MNIDMAYVNQKVRFTETGEIGTVVDIDFDDNMLFVSVPTSQGTDTIDVDPLDVEAV